MPKVRVDPNAHEILKSVRDKMKASGMTMSNLSDAVRWLDMYCKERRSG